jgi:hypothetical protein
MQRPESTQSDFQKDTILGHVRTGLKILENNKNIQIIISVNTNILLRRFRLKFLRIMYSTSCYKERLNFENTLYKSVHVRFFCDRLEDKIVYMIQSRKSFCASPSCRPKPRLAQKEPLLLLMI